MSLRSDNEDSVARKKDGHDRRTLRAMLGRPPEEKLRDSTERAQLEALQFLEGELRDSTSLGEHFREMLRGDKLLSEFTERQNASRAVSGALGREPTVYELLAQRPMRRPATPQNAAPRGLAQDAFDASFPPVCSASSPPDRLGFGTRDAFGTVKPTRPLTVGSANTALYLTSSNSISYPGRKLGLRASSLASLPSAVEVQLQSAATEGKLGGPSTFKVEDPIRNSYTLGFNFKNPSITDVVEARFCPTNWGVYNTAPMRPSLRSALQGLQNDDMRWKHGAWVPRGKVSTPRSESVARFR